jgi:hypothetical protein
MVLGDSPCLFIKIFLAYCISEPTDLLGDFDANGALALYGGGF